MKKIFFLFAFLLSFCALDAQSLERQFTGILSPLNQTGGSAPNFDFIGAFKNNLGEYAGIDAPNPPNDLVMVVADGGKCFMLPVTAVTPGSNITGTVTDPSGQLASIPAGTAYIGQLTPNKKYILEGDLLPQEIMTCIENHNRLKMDIDITGGGGADDWGNQVVVSDASLSGTGTPSDPLMVALDKYLVSMTTTSAQSQMIYQWTYSDGSTGFYIGQQSNGVFSNNTGGTTQTFQYNLGDNTFIDGKQKTYGLTNLDLYQVDGNKGIYYYKDSIAFLSDKGILIRNFGDFTLQNNSGKIFFKNSQVFQGVNVEAGWTWTLIDPVTGEVEFRPPLSAGYKEYPIATEQAATATGDVDNVTVTFANNTWTIDISNSIGGIDNINLIGTAADYDASNHLYFEIIGGKGNESYETIRVPNIDKADFSAKSFGLPSGSNPYAIDIDNNPQAKIVEIGSTGNSKIKIRLEGMNAFSKYSLSLEGL